MSDDKKVEPIQIQILRPAIEHTPYSELTQKYTNFLKQKYYEFNCKFQQPQVQQKWQESKTIMSERTKEFGLLTFDYFLKSFQITKTTATELYNVYKK